MISVFALKPSFLFHFFNIKKKTKTKTLVWGCLILEETSFMEQEGERDWDQFHSPRNLLLALVGEVGELSEIFQWKGEVPRGLPGWEDGEKQHLGEELSDVLLYLVRLSDICGVDLGKAALRKMELNAIKYPVKLCKGSSKKHTQFNGDSGDNADKDQGH
ncbi:hypothetical protein ES288_A02G019300v1 [Gossypium darwinii]|uniref:dCTP pyrophosphatase 1 n=1 Tax=Gossypium darwinii TaxID=34276 RepID=A0A5D2H974_GOSDA|nr:hypothetical protein ES288_A02G019300v1 [Gossypium darwinii]